MLTSRLESIFILCTLHKGIFMVIFTYTDRVNILATSFSVREGDYGFASGILATMGLCVISSWPCITLVV